MTNYFGRTGLLTNGLLYISASDAKERQDWINKLRSVAEFHTSSIAQVLF